MLAPDACSVVMTVSGCGMELNLLMHQRSKLAGQPTSSARGHPLLSCSRTHRRASMQTPLAAAFAIFGGSMQPTVGVPFREGCGVPAAW